MIALRRLSAVLELAVTVGNGANCYSVPFIGFYLPPDAELVDNSLNITTVK